MKKILVPSVLILTILTGGVLAYVIWKASPTSAEEFLKSGKGYYEEKKYSEATVQFLNAVQKDPRNREASYLLALTYLNLGDLNAAAKRLNALLEYYPDDIEANLRLGNIYLAVGRSDMQYFRQASEIAQKVLSLDPKNVAALILFGNAAAGLQDYSSSVESFEKAIGLDPQNVAAFVGLGTFQAVQKNYPDAEQAFLKALQVDPKNKGALLSLSNYYRAVRQNEKAEALMQDALAAHPTDRDIYFQLVVFYYQLGRMDSAERVLQNVQSQVPQDPQPSLLLSDLYASSNRPADARNVLLETKKNHPENLDVAAKLALNLMQDDPERARVEIAQILKTDANNVFGLILQGELQFASGDYDAAAATFGREGLIDGPFPQPRFFLGNIALRKGDIAQAQDHYQKALAANARYLPARVALAEVYLNLGKYADARAETRKALEVQPNSVPARIMKAALDRVEKNYTEAERELLALLKEQPNNPLVHRQMAFYSDSRGRKAEAEKSLVRAVELQPDSEQTLRELTQFYMLSKQPERAIQVIQSVPDEKKSAFHYELMGLVYSEAGKTQEAEKAYHKALEKDPERRSSDVYLAAQYIRSGQFDQGLKKLDELIQKNPADARSIGTKALIYESQGKVDAAKQSYIAALKVDPDFETAANNLAYILAEEGRDLDTALGWAQMARKKQPENPSVADTLGWVYYKRGNFVMARDQLQFAVTKQPENPIFHYHLGLVYKETNQIAEARTALKRAIESPRGFKEKNLAQAALDNLSRQSR